MAAMPIRRSTLLIATLIAALVASPAGAKPALQGTFGTAKFRGKKQFTHCQYSRASSLLSIDAIKITRKKQVGAIVGGMGPDPTVPGATFPIVITGTTGSFVNGRSPLPPTWVTVGTIVITLTNYEKGKLSGTITGTMSPAIGGAAGDIQVDATFAIKCAAGA